ncbi:MAG: hypothetical protein JWO36_1421 [Myxococcales bacterium]|nr:hypothetical protein [Myxococcales bacterium]
MRYTSSRLISGVFVGITVLSQVAEAQMSPGGMGPGMGGPQTPSAEEKKEGVAEAAPKAPGLLPTTPALPPPKGRRKRWKLFELGGYYRMRTDWFKNFNLGFIDNPALGGAPFARALSCSSTVLNHPCDDTLSSTNMRLRLEPVFNLDEGTSVHVQADILDNLVLGSTPTGEVLNGAYTSTNPPPVSAFGTTQTVPEAGINSDRSSILIKRAWAEVAVPLGILKLGRMPNHWGMGIYANSGGYNPFDGTYDYDGDYGDTVDRVSFSALIPGTALRAMVASDWNISRLVSNQQATTNKGNEGHPFNLDNPDDMNSWVGVISKLDSPQDFRDALDRGESVLNYGVYFEYKTQGWDDNLTNFNINAPTVPFDPAAHYVPRDLKTYTASLWGKLAVGDVQLESELVGQFGNIRLEDQGIATSTSGLTKIRKLGGAARLTWRGVEGKLRLGIEGGFATGDQWDNTPQGNTNVAFANRIGDPSVCNLQHTCTLTQFMFNREYKVDLILWRRLFGAVTNAAYAKPFLQYDLTKSIMFKIANITSFAMKPVSTPGNGSVYGTEFDMDLGYSSQRLFAGISYGVLFPFGAMAHPVDDTTAGGAGFGYGTDANGIPNTGDPGTAHTIQTRFVLAF